MLKKLGITFAIAIALVFVVVASRPDTVTVTRSATIDAPADITYGLVADFHGWAQWSPWEALDPGMKKTFGGTMGTVGSTYGWVGNDQVGEGRMTIVDAKPAQQVDIKLEFIKPFASTSQTLISFQEAGGKTTVKWTMISPMNFFTKAMCLVKSMDDMVGPDFEKGLAKLGTAAVAEQARRVQEAAVAAAKAAEAAAKQAAEAAAKKAADEAAAAAAATPAATPKK